MTHTHTQKKASQPRHLGLVYEEGKTKKEKNYTVYGMLQVLGPTILRVWFPVGCTSWVCNEKVPVSSKRDLYQAKEIHAKEYTLQKRRSVYHNRESAW